MTLNSFALATLRDGPLYFWSRGMKMFPWNIFLDSLDNFLKIDYEVEG